MKRFCLFMVLFVLGLSERAVADLKFDMSTPISLQDVEAKVVSATFCHHPVASEDENFRVSPNSFKTELGRIFVEDICAVPGILPPEGEENPLAMMADLQGLCLNGFFNN